MIPRGDGTAWLAAPVVVATLLLVALPAAATAALAFCDYDGLTGIRFSGTKNLRDMAADPLFWKSLGTSALLAALGVPLRLLFALGLALFLAPDGRLTRLARTTAYTPSVIPEVAYALLWLWLLNPLYGPFAALLQALAGTGELLLTPWGARLGLVLMSALQIGEVYVVLLAARRELPSELYELCALEGVSRWFAFRRVTLPLLRPAILFLGARDVAWSLQATFVPALVVTKGGPAFATLVLPLYIYQNGFEYLRFGLAAAMTVAMFVLAAAMLGLQVVALRSWRSSRS